MTRNVYRLSVELLERREVPSSGLVRVTTADLFAGSSADGAAGQPGTNYGDTQVEPMVAANPARENNVVAVWQQDRWSNGSARGIEVGVSTDRGHSWAPVALPGVTRVAGGPFLRATDPWVSFAPNGDLYATSLASDPTAAVPYPFDSSRSAIVVSKSTDGGRRWGSPTTLIDDASPQAGAHGVPTLVFNDKDAVTADPYDPARVYVVWNRITYDLATGEFRGPTYFSRSTDGGRTWEAARPVYDPGPAAQTIGNQIAVLPDGTLVDVFAQGSEATGSGAVAVIRSTDHGRTWSGPVVIAAGTALPLTDPETGVPIRSGDTMPGIAADPRTGAVYVVSQGLQLEDGTRLDGVILSVSADGGLTWSKPVTVNKTPAGLPAASRQVFDPAVRVASDGTVAVTYYDFRNNTPAPGMLADAWAVFADPAARGNRPGGVADPANWGREVRLTDRSFDIGQAPRSTNENPGYFLGDYQGLTTAGGRFLAVFSVAGTEGDATAGVFARWFRPPDRPDTRDDRGEPLATDRSGREDWRPDALVLPSVHTPTPDWPTEPHPRVLSVDGRADRIVGIAPPLSDGGPGVVLSDLFDLSLPGGGRARRIV